MDATRCIGAKAEAVPTDEAGFTAVELTAVVDSVTA
jgi:hypothetical protein